MHFHARSCAIGAVLARKFALSRVYPTVLIFGGGRSARAKLPRAIVLSFRDYVRLAALKPEALTNHWRRVEGEGDGCSHLAANGRHH